ncbi:hypothetical protein L2E82_29865 [Cichorium intybus]|uniref:Uncharacterized protein n=1 Tax=Cichorium intybus TaxID=13427 RepID=A0ACB9CZ51_CICIN|nr:hypothetical protein L2E82_29865 [Cichorium intybus]
MRFLFRLQPRSLNNHWCRSALVWISIRHLMNLDRLWYGSSPDLILIYTSFGLDLHRIWFEFGLDLHRLSFGSPPNFLSIILIPCFIYTGNAYETAGINEI